MTTPNDPTMSHDALDAVIAGYMLAVEAGDFTSRQELLDRHPEHAEALRAFFGDLDRMDRVASPLRLAESLETTGALDGDGHPVPSTIRYFGDYELLEPVARGGMGIVYKARQVSLNRLVAIKMILAGQLASEADVRRFQLEAEAAANLDHPGIVPIYEVGQHDGRHYFSMGFVEGQSLAEKIAAGPLDARRAAELVRRVTEAVQYAHDRGVIHRDLKPANVLLDHQGHPRITDFGLAKTIRDDRGLTATGQVMGTPSYMPPEQASGRGEQIGPAADVYSLGAILYCLLTGRPPFQSSSPTDTILQVLEKEPVPPRELNASAPRDLETIALKCLQKEPRRRYSSARELAEDLDRYLIGQPILARPVGKAERLWRWCRRNPALAALEFAVTALLILVAVGSVFYARKSAANARELSSALGDARQGRSDARSRLRESLIAQARAERLSGGRWAAMKAIADAVRISYSADLRQEAIQAIVTPGVRVAHTIPFGQASVMRFSPDGTLLAVDGRHHGDSRDQAIAYQRVIYRVTDGREVDRVPLGDPLRTEFATSEEALQHRHKEMGSIGISAVGRFAFRPGSSTLAYEDHRTGRRGLRLRDVAKGKELGFLPTATDGLFSPDGKRLVLVQADRLRVVDAESLREERSRPAVRRPAFLSDHELMIEEGARSKGGTSATALRHSSSPSRKEPTAWARNPTGRSSRSPTRPRLRRSHCGMSRRLARSPASRMSTCRPTDFDARPPVPCWRSRAGRGPERSSSTTWCGGGSAAASTACSGMWIRSDAAHFRPMAACSRPTRGATTARSRRRSMSGTSRPRRRSPPCGAAKFPSGDRTAAISRRSPRGQSQIRTVRRAMPRPW